MKSNKQIQKNVLAIALLVAVCGSALAEPSYKFRIPAKGVKRAVHTGPNLPGGTTPTAPGGSVPGGTTTPAIPDESTTPAPGGGVTPESPSGGGLTPATPPGDGGIQDPGPIIITVPPENESAYFSVAKSGFTLNRVTGLYSGTATVTNSSSEPIYGPLHLVFNQVTAGVTIANASGSYGGLPYITMTTTGDPVMPGQKFVVNISFANPQKAGFSYSTLVYSGYVDTP